MLADPCPRCGKPAQLSLAEPGRTRCVACGYDGPPSPAAHERLAHAAHLLSTLAMHERQLSQTQRVAAARALEMISTQRNIAILAGVPFLLVLALGTCAQLAGENIDPVPTFIVLSTPLAIYLVFAIVLQTLVRRARVAAFASCAAIAPVRPGEPASCHVCGGPVGANSTDAIVRCGYCGTDNVVHPSVVVRGKEARDRDLAHLAQHVAATSSDLRNATFKSSLMSVGVAILTPFASFVVAMACVVILLVVSDSWEAEPFDQRYAIVPTSKGSCFGRVRPAQKDLDLGTWRPDGVNQFVDLPAGTPTFGVHELIGRKVRMRTGPSGPIVRVHGRPIWGDNALVVGGKHQPIQGTCLDEAPLPPG